MESSDRAQQKYKFAVNSVRFILSEVYEGFEIVTPQWWQSLIKHVEENVEIIIGSLMDLMKNSNYLL